MSDEVSHLGLSDSWRVWLVDNLLAGVDGDDLVATLVSEGAPRDLAVAEVAAISTSPALVGAQHFAERLKRAEMVLALQRSLAAQSPTPTSLTLGPMPEPDDFFRDHLAANRPGFFSGVFQEWPMAHWTWEGLRERLGTTQVEACVDREADPRCDAGWKEHVAEMSFGDFLDRVFAAEGTNDVYLISNNRALRREGFRELLDDVMPDERMFDPSRLAGACSLWIGPGGTRTPLHHDNTNILFLQVLGRKRIRLIAPAETRLWDRMNGFYCEVDLDALGRDAEPELADALVVDVILEPGHALFIPAGWFHDVVALETSLSFSLLNFRRKNGFERFAPGRASLLRSMTVEESRSDPSDG